MQYLILWQGMRLKKRIVLSERFEGLLRNEKNLYSTRKVVEYRFFVYSLTEGIHLWAIISLVASMLDLFIRIKSLGVKVTAP